jgi:hypothetical protein
MSYYAKSRNGSVQLYRDGQGIPVSTFGSGCGIVSALVSGDEIYCETSSGNTLVYQINGNSANLIRSFR